MIFSNYFLFVITIIISNANSKDVYDLLVMPKNKKGLNHAQKISSNVKMELCSNVLAVSATKDEMKKLKKDPDIEMVEEDSIVQAFPKKLRKGSKKSEEVPYGINMVLQNDLDFWEDKTPDGSVKVCVADTGYDKSHNDLPSGNDVIGRNSKNNGKWDFDAFGHGTHVAGTVAAIGGNKRGVRGLIPSNYDGKFKLVIGKALSDDGYGQTSDVLKAVCDCVAEGATVVNLSLGGPGKESIAEKTYKDLYQNHDVLIIAAAGNGGNRAKSYPASYSSVMSVAAIDSDEKVASFSQENDQVEISAPGVQVMSTIPQKKYDSWDGTSMASPHVAGVAGLLRMYFPKCKNYQIRNAMLESAKDISSKGCDSKTGYGIIQAKEAYKLLEKNCGGDLGNDKPVGGCGQLNGGNDDDEDDEGGDDDDKGKGDDDGDDGYGFFDDDGERNDDFDGYDNIDDYFDDGSFDDDYFDDGSFDDNYFDDGSFDDNYFDDGSFDDDYFDDGFLDDGFFDDGFFDDGFFDDGTLDDNDGGKDDYEFENKYADDDEQ